MYIKSTQDFRMLNLYSKYNHYDHLLLFSNRKLSLRASYLRYDPSSNDYYYYCRLALMSPFCTRILLSLKF